MSPEPDGMLVLIDAATERLLTTVRGFGDDDVRQPSSLPGWRRGHVLTHLARGGEAISRLLDGVRTGVLGRAHVSQEERDEAIERGAGRGASELMADLTESAARFRDAAVAVPADAWDRPARGLVGDPFQRVSCSSGAWSSSSSTTPISTRLHDRRLAGGVRRNGPGRAHAQSAGGASEVGGTVILHLS